MKQIILFPKGQLSSADKTLLRKSYYIPLEVDDPSKVILIFPNQQKITGDALTVAALKSIQGSTSGQERQKFADELIKSLIPK